MSNLLIQEAQPSDASVLAKLFETSIRSICTDDYTNDQIEAWVGRGTHPQQWQKRMTENKIYIAFLDGSPAGFIGITPPDYINYLFVSPDHARKGVAQQLLDHILLDANGREVKQLTSHASKTALPFFQVNGFKLQKENRVEVENETLTNYLVLKTL